MLSIFATMASYCKGGSGVGAGSGHKEEESAWLECVGGQLEGQSALGGTKKSKRSKLKSKGDDNGMANTESFSCVLLIISVDLLSTLLYYLNINTF